MSWSMRGAVGALTGACLLAGCATDDVRPEITPVATAKSGADVGTVSVDIVSIDQWADIQNRFKSNYGVTGAAAVKTVSQAAAYESAARIRSTSGGLGLELDGSIIGKDVSSSSQNTSTTGSTTTGGVTTPSSSNSSTTSSGVTSDSKLSTPASAPAATPSTAGAVASSAFGATQTPSLAPMLALQAGDGLFKYAAVLDGGYGQIAPCGYVPILITFRISIIPSKRNMPYDTFVDLSLLPGAYTLGQTADPGASASSKTSGLGNTSALALKVTPGSQGQRSKGRGSSENLGSSDPAHCGYMVRDNDFDVLSFSSDSLENTQSDIVAQQTKALMLAAAVRAGTVAGSANFQHLSESLDHALTLHPNSLLSVGKHGRGGLHIKLGANRFGANDFEMLPLEHDVSVLVLIPFQSLGRPLTALAHYSFVDARTSPEGSVKPISNAPLPDADADWLSARTNYMQRVAQTVIADHPTAATRPALKTCNEQADCAELANIAYRIYNGNFDDFLTGELVDGDADLGLDLWERLSPWAAKPGVSLATTTIPYTLRICPVTSGAILVKDDGTNATASVNGADGYAGQHITATLSLSAIRTEKQGKKSVAKQVDQALLQSYDVGNSDIGDLQFNSFSNVFKPTDDVSGTLIIASRDGLVCPSPGTGPYRVKYVLTPADKKAKTTTTAPKATPGVSAYPGQIAETGSKGQFGFSISLDAVKADTVDVSSGSTGQLDSVGAALPKKGVVTLTTSGDYAAQFENLTSGKPLEVTFQFKAKGKSVSKSAITLAVTKP